MESVRPASTIMLARNSKDNIEILMVRRNTKSVFGNLYVFPGGKVDIDDRSEELYSLSRNLDDVEASRALGMQKDGLAYWVAGLRECFEEVGILLHDASQIIDHQLKVNQRTELNNGKTNFLDICKAQKLNLPTDSMIPISHWITPVSYTHLTLPTMS